MTDTTTPSLPAQGGPQTGEKERPRPEPIPPAPGRGTPSDELSRVQTFVLRRGDRLWSSIGWVLDPTQAGCFPALADAVAWADYIGDAEPALLTLTVTSLGPTARYGDGRT